MSPGVANMAVAWDGKPHGHNMDRHGPPCLPLVVGTLSVGCASASGIGGAVCTPVPEVASVGVVAISVVCILLKGRVPVVETVEKRGCVAMAMDPNSAIGDRDSTANGILAGTPFKADVRLSELGASVYMVVAPDVTHNLTEIWSSRSVW